MKETGEFTVEDHPRPGYSTTVKWRYARGVPLGTGVQVDGGEQIVSAEILREVSVRDLLKAHIMKDSGTSIPKGVDVEKMRSAAESSEFRRADAVRAVYASALKQAIPPVAAVMKVFDLPRHIAARRIRESRNLLGWT